jgi:hypothetical protein
VDYLNPAGSGVEAQTMCTLLSSPGTWFWHSTLDTAVATVDATAATAAGPWKARVGNHDALVGGAIALVTFHFCLFVCCPQVVRVLL